MNESMSVSSIIDKLPSPWRDFKNMLKHKKDSISLFELGNSLRIEDDIRAHEKVKKPDVSSFINVNVMEEISQKGNESKSKKRPSNNTNSGFNKKSSLSRICASKI